MFGKQQNWIALMVLMAFIWTMHFSVMPLKANSPTEQVCSVSAEQTPDYFEAVSQKNAPAKKKSMLPLIVIGAGVLAVTAVVLFLFGLLKYDIRGRWTVIPDFPDNGEESGGIECSFIGTRESGRTGALANYSGQYAVAGNKVSWTLFDIECDFLLSFTGQFDSRNTMSGTTVFRIPPAAEFCGTWTATRGWKGVDY